MRARGTVLGIVLVVTTIAALSACTISPQVAKIRCDAEFMHRFGVPISLSSDLIDYRLVREWYRAHPECVPQLVVDQPPPPPRNDVSVRPLMCGGSSMGGTAIVVQTNLQNITNPSSDIPAGFTVTLEQITINGQPFPNLTTTVAVPLLAGTTLAVPSVGDWTLTAPALPAMLAATVIVRQGTQVIGQRPRACMVT
jgi:hypothetical protein